MVTCRSCIASSSALCTLAGARLISSASTRFAKTGPSLEVNSLLLVVDERADRGRPAGRSGVNWMRSRSRTGAMVAPARCESINVSTWAIRSSKAPAGAGPSRAPPSVRAAQHRTVSSSCPGHMVVVDPQRGAQALPRVRSSAPASPDIPGGPARRADHRRVPGHAPLLPPSGIGARELAAWRRLCASAPRASRSTMTIPSPTSTAKRYAMLGGKPSARTEARASRRARIRSDQTPFASASSPNVPICSKLPSTRNTRPFPCPCPVASSSAA
jgi:hypothetical protein